ncbi:Calcipressin-domain-containing protein [Lipomyces oligophaga]|uniref:Calcipressin-domain-containing protein n=1 Tax=Lipomyces oligophaga TaxID=45792 RepID=UPI0034CDF064
MALEDEDRLEISSVSSLSSISSVPSSPTQSLRERRLSRHGSVNSMQSLEISSPNSGIMDPSVPMTNTLVITGLVGPFDFHPYTLTRLYEIVVNTNADGELLHWGPLPSFGRIVVVFKTVSAALAARMTVDGLSLRGYLPPIELLDEDSTSNAITMNAEGYDFASSVLKVYFGESTPIEPLLRRLRGDTEMSELERARDTTHLQLPDPGKLFLISPPPSPPVGWKSIEEDPPNKDIGVPGNILADALSKLTTSSGEQSQRYKSDEGPPLHINTAIDVPKSPLTISMPSSNIGSDSNTSAQSAESRMVVLLEPSENFSMPGIVVSPTTDLEVTRAAQAFPRTEMPPVD